MDFSDVKYLRTSRSGFYFVRSPPRSSPFCSSYVQVQRIEGLHLVDQTEDDLFAGQFVLEGAEHPVPDDEPSAVVLVQAVLVTSCVPTDGEDTIEDGTHGVLGGRGVVTVVDLVVGGRVEDPLERPQFTDDARVQPELVEQVQLQVHQVVRRRNYDGDRQIAKLEESETTWT